MRADRGRVGPCRDGDRPVDCRPDIRTSHETSLRLADGRRVSVRPILPSDAPELAEAIRAAQFQRRCARVLGGPPRLTEAFLTGSPGWTTPTSSLWWRTTWTGRGVAVARYMTPSGSGGGERGRGCRGGRSVLARCRAGHRADQDARPASARMPASPSSPRPSWRRTAGWPSWRTRATLGSRSSRASPNYRSTTAGDVIAGTDDPGAPTSGGGTACRRPEAADLPQPDRPRGTPE